jgi:transposase
MAQTPRAPDARGEEGMHDMVKRHEVQVLRKAGHSIDDVARQTGVSASSVKRIADEAPVEAFDDAGARKARGIGRPSKVEGFRNLVEQLVRELDSHGAPLRSGEILRRAKLEGYAGGKSALFSLIASARPKDTTPLVRFEGVAGEFSQHDFGQVDVRYVDGTKERVHFFASRLKYSRFMQVSLVEDERVESLLRSLLAHYEAFQGVPLVAVFDNPSTVVLRDKTKPDGRRFNPTFAEVMLDLGVAIELCTPRRGQEKGAVENLVGYVKGSFFKQRVFVDKDDLIRQLAAWLDEVNTRVPSRATGVTPEARMAEERARLRPLKVSSSSLALRFVVRAGPTGFVVFERHQYGLHPDAVGLPATLHLFRDRVRIVAGRHDVTYPRPPDDGPPQKLEHPQLKADRVARVAGQRGRLYLKREQLLDLGDVAMNFITNLVHRKPHGWARDVLELHDLHLKHDAETMRTAMQRALDEGDCTATRVHSLLAAVPLRLVDGGAA